MYLGIFSINDTIYFRATTVNKQGSAIDASSGPSFTIYADGSSTAIATGTMSKVGAKIGFYEGSFTVSEGSYTPGQHFILLEATVDGQLPKGQIAFQLVSDDQSVEETFQEIQLIGEQVPSIGEGSVSIDHNYGGADTYRVVANGTPLADVEVRAFIKSDYDAGRKSNAYVVGQTRTLTDGRWATVIRLDPGSYTLEFSKVGAYKTATSDVTVSAGAMSMSISAMSFDTMTDSSASEPSNVTSFAVATTTVDHNYPNKDDMRLVSGGKPIKGADIRVYHKSDYDAGRQEEAYVLQRTTSRADGRWAKSLALDVGHTYVIHFSKKGVFKAHTKVIKV